ncbi:helix-turn-helix domain-containing protein, partial [Ketobacter sp.]
AADCLLQAITISEAPGYRRLFLDEGAALIPLLRILVKEGKRGWWEVALIAKGRQSSSKGLVEPLTTREQEVLDLIAQGLSNQSIADHLHIAMATTKAHLRNIYEKLAVSSRTQAVAKARELGLLE